MTNKFTVEIRKVVRKDPDMTYLLVAQIWEGVDRPYTGGYSCGMNMKLAQRLKKAMEAGVAFPFKEVRTDMDGQTYVHTEYNVNCRTMNASLRKLGY